MIKAGNTPSQNTKVLAWYVQVVQKPPCTNVPFWRNSQKLRTVSVEANNNLGAAGLNARSPRLLS